MNCAAVKWEFSQDRLTGVLESSHLGLKIEINGYYMQAATFLAEKKREKGRESAEDRCSLQILYFTDMDVTMSANRSLLVRKIGN